MADHKQQVLSLTPGEALAFLVREAQALPRDRRVAIGITGGPGVGKSTLATELVAALNALEPVAAYVPMDGFHMLHAKLEQLGTVADKGAPHTFEGEAFTSFISTLKSASGPVSGPGYSREIEDVVQDAFIIAADFIGNDSVMLVLGDNIFYGQGLGTQLAKRVAENDGATVFTLER